MSDVLGTGALDNERQPSFLQTKEPTYGTQYSEETGREIDHEVRLIRFHGVLALHAALRSQIVPGEPDQAPNTPDEHGDAPYASTQARMSWAQLLKRIFAIDMAACPQCGGPLTILAAIEDPTVIAKILAHLGLPTRAPPKTPARLDGLLQTA